MVADDGDFDARISSCESVASLRRHTKLSAVLSAAAVHLASSVGCDEVDEKSEMVDGCWAARASQLNLSPAVAGCVTHLDDAVEKHVARDRVCTREGRGRACGLGLGAGRQGRSRLRARLNLHDRRSE